MLLVVVLMLANVNPPHVSINTKHLTKIEDCGSTTLDQSNMLQSMNILDKNMNMAKNVY